MYISIEELKTHCYDEDLQAIIRGDETIAHACIDMAIEFAATKLMKVYDVDKIFAAKADKRNPLLVKIIKDIAVWEIMGLANISTDYNDKKFRYEQAVSWLNAVYKGMPANLPKKEETRINTSVSFAIHSNPKRTNHY